MSKGNAEFAQKWKVLLAKYTKALYLLKQSRLKINRLVRNYTKLKFLYLNSKKSAHLRSSLLLEQSLSEKYQLIIDHQRHIRHVDPQLLAAMEMDRQQLTASFYIDVLFQHFLPDDFTITGEVAIPQFHFPVMVEHSTVGGDLAMHPFIHLEMSGKREYQRKNRMFMYYLSVKDISPEIELEYFHKTDKLIKTLSTANNQLQSAKKSIEMHKIMLISLVCSLIEEHNKETAEHLQKIRILTEHLTRECRRLNLIRPGTYPLSEYMSDISYTSVLHDIGKAAIPRELIQKEGSLTPDEFAVIKQHPVYGAGYIKKILDMFNVDPAYAGYTGFLNIPYQICMYHHERWDGRGYPRQLAGQSIPFPARVVAVVDAYDAMRAQRSYNSKKSHEECLEVLKEERGHQFDPAIVQAFLNIERIIEDLSY
ncbi:MAG: HD domain-containing protein [Spirochaetes bacterium]|nr:HD domain-containing protein [Spirochaetota bacterium]MBU0954919.1 HD domain-containing protein [Spirochaetota bacterium]